MCNESSDCQAIIVEHKFYQMFGATHFNIVAKGGRQFFFFSHFLGLVYVGLVYTTDSLI